MRQSDAEFICEALRENAHTRLASEDPRVSEMGDAREIDMIRVVMGHVYRRWSQQQPRHGQRVLVRGKEFEAEVRVYKHHESDPNWCKFVRECDGYWYAATEKSVEWMPLP